MRPGVELPALRRLRALMAGLVCIFGVSLLLWIVKSDQMPQLQAPSRRVFQPTASQNPTAGNTVLRGQPACLLRVNGSRTLLISAYLEHRTTKKEVRVIAMKLRRERVALRCHLRCLDLLHASEAAISVHRDHFRFPYGTADVLCPIPPACQAPTHVAVTSAAIGQEEKSDLEFLKIKNQKAVNISFPHNFTTCFSAMYNFTNVLQLVQSLEMLQLLGVTKVVFYKTNCSADAQRVLDYYTNKGLVEVIPWSLSNYLKVSRKASPQKDPGDIHYFGQIPALNDCLYRNMYRSRYVAMHDVDELILPQAVASWSELLPLLERKYGADRCYMFENNWIPSEFALPPPRPNRLPPPGRWQSVSGVNILAHLYREPFNPRRRRRNFKVIVNPRAVFLTTVHGVLKAKKSSVWVNRKMARMYHIKPRGQTDMKPQRLVYEGRLLSYSAALSSAVDAVLDQTGLLLDDGSN